MGRFISWGFVWIIDKMVVDYRILDRIDKKKSVIERDPGYYLKVYRAVKSKLKRSANIHSYWMENPRLRKSILEETGQKDSRGLKRLAKEGICDLITAWEYLHNQVEDSEDMSFITPRNVLDVGSRVEPKINMGFRSLRASLGLRNYVPPNPVKVPDLIEEFCYNVRESDLHPIESAINCHLHIAGIQPFLDGNKRTGRIFQDTILYSNGYPPGLILISDREKYIDKLENALVAVRDKDLDGQRDFFNYLAENIDLTLSRIVKDMKQGKRDVA
jgi:hypothetical protein